MRKILLIFFIYSQTIFAQSFIIKHDKNAVSLHKQNNYTSISYKNITDISPFVQKTGDPHLPAYSYRIALQPGETVTSVRIINQEWQEIAQDLNLTAVKPLWSQHFAERIDDHSGSGSDTLPASNIILESVQHLHGYPVAHLTVFPFQFEKESGTLKLLKSVEFELIREFSQKEVVKRESLEWSDRVNLKKQFERVLSVSSDASAVIAADLTESSDNKASRLHHLDRYIVVTTEELKEAFKPLVDWKTRKGVPAYVKTLEEIRNEFPEGKDDAERIRNFIRWTYQHKGTRYVMLGGDTDVIPSRIVTTGYYTFPTDYYYADLDGSWNEDQDDIFGEAVDDLEGYPEVYVSRIPVHAPEEIADFIAKLFKYEKLEGVSDPDYFSQVLYLAANLKRDNDGRDLINNHIDPMINPDFNRVMITQNEHVGSDPSVALAELNKNYGIIFSENHGAYDNARPGAKGSNIYNYMIEDVENKEPGIWYMASCETNNIIKRSFSEVYMLASNGGGVAYIGNSSWEYPFSGIYLQKEFFDLVFNRGYYNLGEAHFLSRYPYLGHIGGEGPARVIVFSTLILGDPEMPVWTDSPKSLILELPEVVASGYNQMSVNVRNVSGLAEEGVDVVLYQPDGIYYKARSDIDGNAYFDFSLAEDNTISVTAVKHNFIPAEGEIPVSQSSSAKLELQNFHLHDLTGNLNGQCEPGEMIELNLNIKNGGMFDLKSEMVVSIENDDSHIALADSQITIENPLTAGDSITAGPFKFNIHKTVDIDSLFSIDVYIRNIEADPMARFSVDFPVYIPAIQVSETNVVTMADPYNPGSNLSHIDIKLKNTGKGTATNLTGQLIDLPKEIQPLNERINFGNLNPGAESWSRENLVLSHQGSLDSIKIKLKFESENGVKKPQWIDFNRPGIPEGLAFRPADANAIELHWDPVSSDDILGYHIYRNDQNQENFLRITTEPVDLAGYFVDTGLVPGVLYEYKIEAIDSSGNISPEKSDALTAWSSLPDQQGFPMQLDLQSVGSEINGIQIFDLDQNGTQEIIASGANGVLQVFDAAGTVIAEFYDLEGNLTIPAVGNVYGDETMEIIVSAYAEGKNLNAIYIVDALNGVLIQEIDLGYNAPTHVLLDDLDFDAYEDIIILTHAGNAPEPPKNSKLLIWKSTGTAWIPFPGWSADGYLFNTNYNLGNPAVADIDGSGRKSILVGGINGELFRFQPADSAAPVWNYSYPGKLNSPVSLADLNRDGKMEIMIVAAGEDKLYVFDSEGMYFPGWENGIDVDPTDPYSRISPAIAGNVDADEQLEVILTGRKNAYVFDHTSELLTGWPVAIENGNSYSAGEPKPWGVFSSPILADINADGTQDIVFVTSDGKLNALNGFNGDPVIGFPIDITNASINGQSPAVADVDLDGDLEVLLIGHDGLLMNWDMPNPYTGEITLEWAGPMANRRNSGTYEPLVIKQDPNSISENDRVKLPETHSLKPNYPNPFNPVTTIEYTVGYVRATRLAAPAGQEDFSPQRIDLSIYNTLGQKVAMLVSEKQLPGKYKVKWDASGFASGIYFYKLSVNELDVQTRKLILIR